MKYSKTVEKITHHVALSGDEIDQAVLQFARLNASDNIPPKKASVNFVYNEWETVEGAVVTWEEGKQ